MARTRNLDAHEIRVVGALFEKQQTTPEIYPMTVNALVAACNQKTNRDPILQLSDAEVQAALDRLRQDAIVWKSVGARSVRWQQSLDRRWELDAPAKAVMTLLLLRGPQTAGELRTRSERLHVFESVEDVDTVLQRLSEGFDALVKEEPRRPGQRETRWCHLVGVEGATADEPAGADEATPIAADRPAFGQRLDQLEAEVAALRDELRALRQRLGDDA